MHRRFVSGGSWCLALLAMLVGASFASAAAPVLQSAVSRMTHGSAGTFDVQLPLTGNSGIECRRVDLGMTIVMTYDVALTSNGVPTITGATGTQSLAGNVATVTLSNVVGPTVTIKPNVKNGANVSVGVATVRILTGDVTSDGIVNTGDVNGVRFFVANGYPVDGTDFRCDVDLSGVLNGADVNFIRGQASISASVAGGATTNTAPTLTGPIADMSALRGQTTAAVNFTVADAESNPSTLGVLISSSDQSTIPNSSVVVTNSGGNCSFTITPAATPITTTTVTITLQASDGLLTSSPISFNVTVSPAPTVFLATLAPVNGVTSLGSGSATLIVSGDQTSASLRYSFSNLAGNDSDDQIYAPPLPPSQGVGLFDVPTLAHPNHLQPDGSILWANPSAAALNAIFSNTAYMLISSSKYGSGELIGTFQKVVGSQTFTPPAAPPSITIDPPSLADASRLLQQAAFGGKYSEIVALSNGGGTAIEDWLTGQFNSTPPITPTNGAVPSYKAVVGMGNSGGHATFTNSSMLNDLFKRTTDTIGWVNPANSVTEYDSYDWNEPYSTWWKNVITQPDQLRQRIATAYTELFVISRGDPNFQYQPDGLASYYDMLACDAFGNYRQLIEDVTLHPGMGEYLTMTGNNYSGVGFAPNENYAREIQQLFSIGLYMLQPDGSLMLDVNGQPIPTYSQPEITNLANVFTGFNQDTASTVSFVLSGSLTINSHWDSPLVVTAGSHSPLSKTLMSYPGAATFPGAGTPSFIPANASQTGGVNGTAMKEFEYAMDLIYNHPNVGPFICKQLIQRLVTSNPTPGYVYRVAQVFANDGTGVRGNMRAVFQAIFTDYEARSPVVRHQPGYGKTVEPVIHLANVLRCFNAKSKTGQYFIGATDNTLVQSILNSPTVFNFFTPSYQQPGAIQTAGLVSPEFNIIYTTTGVQMENLIYQGIYDAVYTTGTGTGAAYGTPTYGFVGTGPYPIDRGLGFTDGGSYPYSPEVALDFSAATGNGLLAVQTNGDDGSALIDQIGLILMGTDPAGSNPATLSPMDTNMRNKVKSFIGTASAGNVSGSVPVPANALTRAEAALHLIASSAQANTQK